MASIAQIQANRLNARKSTGPRTAEGKERASRNAIKHGLLAREAVIAGEDAEEFEVYREGMIEELSPAGVVETMLAERVVGLSWRLRRAERLQNAAFAALDECEPTDLLEARLEEWKQIKGSEWDRTITGVVDENAALAEVVVEDFGGARVLDRMLMYERRIESSLYRTMGQLRKEREARTATTTPEDPSPSQDSLPADQGPATRVELGSFGAKEVSSDGSDSKLPTSHFRLPKITPDGPGSGPGQAPPAKAGVTTNEERRATRPPSETLHPSRITLHGPSCETNPISTGGCG